MGLLLLGVGSMGTSPPPPPTCDLYSAAGPVVLDTGASPTGVTPATPAGNWQASATLTHDGSGEQNLYMWAYFESGGYIYANYTTGGYLQTYGYIDGDAYTGSGSNEISTGAPAAGTTFTWTITRTGSQNYTVKIVNSAGTYTAYLTGMSFSNQTLVSVAWAAYGSCTLTNLCVKSMP